jgi:hypothetical protein
MTDAKFYLPLRTAQRDLMMSKGVTPVASVRCQCRAAFEERTIDLVRDIPASLNVCTPTSLPPPAASLRMEPGRAGWVTIRHRNGFVHANC